MIIVIAKNLREFDAKLKQGDVLKAYGFYPTKNPIWVPSGENTRNQCLNHQRRDPVVELLYYGDRSVGVAKSRKVLLKELLATELDKFAKVFGEYKPSLQAVGMHPVVKAFCQHAKVCCQGCPTYQVDLLCWAFQSAFEMTAGCAVNSALYNLRAHWNDVVRRPSSNNGTPDYFVSALGVKTEQQGDAFLALLDMLQTITLIDHSQSNETYQPPAYGGYCGGVRLNDGGRVVAVYGTKPRTNR